MASPRSSADEGEIVERQGAGHHHFKAKTSATGSAAVARAGDSVDISNVDRRNRNPRGRISRSPDLHRAGGGSGGASLSSYPYRNTSPRGQKRQRDDRDASSNNGGGGMRSGRGGDRYGYDNPRDNRRREDARDSPRAGNDNRYWDRDTRDRNQLRYDDVSSSNSNRPAAGKRQRTRSRSPPPSSFRGSNGNWARNDRDRDRRDRDRGRDRDYDRNRDRDSYRDDRDRGVRFDSSTNGGGYTEPNGRKQAGQQNDPTDHSRAGTHEEAQEDETLRKAPLPQEDWVEQAPVDEEAEIRRRRQRRDEILRKSRTSTPSLASPVQGAANKSAASTPADTKADGTPSVSNNDTPRSADAGTTASPASHAQDDVETMNLANDQDFMNALGKQNVGDGADDGPSAADYDPTVDMEEDERRDELRHGGTVAGLHGADRRESLAAPAEDKDQGLAPAGGNEAEPENKAEKGGQDDDDDDDDMFAEDFVEKKYEAPNVDAASAASTAAKGKNGAAGGAGMLPTATANGGGILDGDDIQGYYKIRRGEILDGRYQIQSALGKGMFSGVARAWDISTADKREVAIKIMRNNDALRKGGYTEIAILQKLNEADPENKKHIVRFDRSFDFRGHLCMSFENLSMNLREVLKKFGNNVGINLHGVRVYAYQIFVALAHMRRCSVIHADLKPDNILVNENRSTLKICDLGTAIDRSDAATAHMEITPYLVSRFYRAPEIILGMPYDYAVDMWSIGCTLYELYTGKILFTGESNNQMLRAIMEIRGKISGKLYRRGELWRMHFDDMGGFLSQEHDKFQGKTTIKTLPVIKPTRDLRTRLQAASAGMNDAESRDLSLFHDLLDRCLSLNPDKRILPGDALKHPFFTSRTGR